MVLFLPRSVAKACLAAGVLANSTSQCCCRLFKTLFLSCLSVCYDNLNVDYSLFMNTVSFLVWSWLELAGGIYSPGLWYL